MYALLYSSMAEDFIRRRREHIEMKCMCEGRYGPTGGFAAHVRALKTTHDRTGHFDDDPHQWVRVDDNSGEPNDGEMRIVADTIRIVPVSVETSDKGIDHMTDGGMVPITDAGMMPTDMNQGVEDGAVIDRQRPDAGTLLSPDDTDEDEDGDPVFDTAAPSGVRAEGRLECSITTLPDMRSLLSLGVVALFWRRRLS